MSFTGDILQAQLHKEVYIALLRSALRDHGSQRQLCAELGISSSHLQYLLDPVAYDKVRTTKLLETVVRSAPLDREQKQHALEHIYLARQTKITLANAIDELVEGPNVTLVMEELREAQEISSFSSSAHLSNVYYRALRDATKFFLTRVNARRHPLDFVETCLLLHEVQCVLNRPDDALYHAKLASNTMTALQREDFSDDIWRFDHYLVNTTLAEGLAYHNLGLDVQAYALYEEAESLLRSDAREQSGFWAPYISRMKLSAIRGMGRFTVGEVEHLASQARMHLEKRGDDHAPLVSLLVDESLSRALVRYGGAQALRKADRILTQRLTEVDKIPHIGALHRAIFYRGIARLRWVQGDRGGFSDSAYFVGLAMSTAAEAGLVHQLRELQIEFGDWAASEQETAPTYSVE